MPGVDLREMPANSGSGNLEVNSETATAIYIYVVTRMKLRLADGPSASLTDMRVARETLLYEKGIKEKKRKEKNHQEARICPVTVQKDGNP